MIKKIIFVLCAFTITLLPFNTHASQNKIIPKSILGNTQENTIHSLSDIAIDSKDNIYIIDKDNNSIYVFDKNKELLKSIDNISANGIFIDSFDNIYVCTDTTIIKFNSILEKEIIINSKLDNSFFTDIVVNEKGYIFAVDNQNNCIQVFNSKLLHETTISTYENEVFNSPTSITISNNQNIYISDTNNKKIIVFDKNNNFINSFKDAATTLSFSPTYMTFSNNNLYVSDKNSSRILIYESNGKLIEEINNISIIPSGIAVDSNKNILVCDLQYKNILKINQEKEIIDSIYATNSSINMYGVTATYSNDTHTFVSSNVYNTISVYDNNTNKIVKTIGSSNTHNESFNNIKDLAVDSSGNIYIADTNNHRIQVFNKDMNFDYIIGEYGHLNGKFNLPTSIALDSNNNLYVLDSGNKRIQVFEANGAYKFQFGLSDLINPTSIRISNSDEIYISDTESNSIKIFDSSGILNREFSYKSENKFIPLKMALDSNDNVYIIDNTFSKILLFNKYGEYLNTISDITYYNNKLSKITSIHITNNDNLILSDAINNTVITYINVNTTNVPKSILEILLFL